MQGYQSADPASWWSTLTSRYQRNVITDTSTGDIRAWPLNFSPSFDSWGSDDGWTNIVLDEGETDKHNSSSSTDAGASGSYFFWSAGVNYKKDEGSTFLDVKNFHVEFQVKRVGINRRWLNSGVFYSHLWTWSPQASDSSPISTGGDTGHLSTLSGQMPLLPVEVVLARRVRLTGSWNTETTSFVNSQNSAQGGFGFGPFSFGGHYNKNSHDDYYHATPGSAGISFDPPQIIGFYCVILPACPSMKPH